AVHVGPSDDGGPEPYRGTGGIPRTSPRMITRSWPISCKRLRRQARTASWVCRKLWRIVTIGCLDGRIGRGYRKEPEAWCFDVHYHIMQDQPSITLLPAVAHLNREASRRRLLRGCCC